MGGAGEEIIEEEPPPPEYEYEAGQAVHGDAPVRYEEDEEVGAAEGEAGGHRHHRGAGDHRRSVAVHEEVGAAEAATAPAGKAVEKRQDVGVHEEQGVQEIGVDEE